MSTTSRPCPAGDMCCRGSNLRGEGGTGDEGDTGGAVFSLAVADAFGDGDGFVGGEVGDIIGRWLLGGGIGLEYLWGWHEGIAEVSLPLDQHSTYPAVFGSFCQDCTHIDKYYNRHQLHIRTVVKMLRA